MHEIIFYKNKKGEEPVLEYMQELSESNGKDSRIKLNKINDYIQALSVDGKYVLLHQFMKKTEKTPIREIRKAKSELKDFKERSGWYGTK